MRGGGDASGYRRKMTKLEQQFETRKIPRFKRHCIFENKATSLLLFYVCLERHRLPTTKNCWFWSFSCSFKQKELKQSDKATLQVQLNSEGALLLQSVATYWLWSAQSPMHGKWLLFFFFFSRHSCYPPSVGLS